MQGQAQVELRRWTPELRAQAKALAEASYPDLKSAVTALPDGTVIGFEPLVDDPTVFGTFLAVPEESGSHVVLLGGETVLMAADAPSTAALLRMRGLDVVTVDISEFQRLEGCVTCLSVRMRRPLVGDGSVDILTR